MKRKGLPTGRYLPMIALAASFAMSACMDNKYDFDEIDATMGFGGGELGIPASSTDTIKLLDVLELDADDCVKEKENGDYVFEQNGGSVEPARPEIDRVLIRQREVVSHAFTISPAVAASRGMHAPAVPAITAAGRIYSFSYSADRPEDVIDLSVAESQADINITVPVNELAVWFKAIDRITLEVPSYMLMEKPVSNAGNFRIEGSKLIFENVTTAKPLTFSAYINRLDFNGQSTLGDLEVTDREILVDGELNMSMTVTPDNFTAQIATFTGAEIRTKTTMSDFWLEGATGRFAPSIHLKDLGAVAIEGVPDFLTGGNVCVDLANPQIQLSLSNDMDVEGFVSGVITAVKDGRTIAAVNVPEMNIKAAKTTNICICRTKQGVEGYDVVQEAPNLSDLIRTIPDNISFAATARADDSRISSVEFGKSYTIAPTYKVVAPVAFAKDAAIVYNDTIDGWNEDIKDIELSDGSYISLTANVENRVPAYLALDVIPVDTEGNRIPAENIEVEVDVDVIASPDGENSATTPLAVKVVQKKRGAMKKLDGLVLSVKGTATSANGATSVVGKTLNSKKHFLIAKDIKIKVVGQIIADMN